MDVSYRTTSLKKTRTADRIQFFIAAFTLLLGYLNSLDKFTDWFLLLPIVGFLLVIANVLMIIFYDKFQDKYGEFFELYAFKLNGIIMLITAFGFQFDGTNKIQYVYYLLAFVYFVFLPRIILRVRGKMILGIEEDGITDNRKMSKPIKIHWAEVKEIKLKDELLTITTRIKPKPKKYYLSLGSETELNQLLEKFRSAEKENKLTFYLDE